MGIFIKNFEVPKNCIQCIFFDEIMLGCNLFSYGCIDRYKINPHKRQEWCELININIPHGRLADKSVPSGIASVCVCGLMHRAADAIEELQAHYCPHMIRNVHDRGDDSLCRVLRTEPPKEEAG